MQTARAAPDPFEVLGVEPSADEKEVKRAYRKLALRCARTPQRGPLPFPVTNSAAQARGTLAQECPLAEHDRLA